MPRLKRCEMTIRASAVYVQLQFSSSSGKYKYRKQINRYIFRINIIFNMTVLKGTFF